MSTPQPPDSGRPTREIAVIAAIGLVGATLGAVAGMAYGVVVQGDSSAALVSIASIGIGSLATLAGASVTRRKPPENQD